MFVATSNQIQFLMIVFTRNDRTKLSSREKLKKTIWNKIRKKNWGRSLLNKAASFLTALSRKSMPHASVFCTHKTTEVSAKDDYLFNSGNNPLSTHLSFSYPVRCFCQGKCLNWNEILTFCFRSIYSRSLRIFYEFFIFLILTIPFNFKIRGCNLYQIILFLINLIIFFHAWIRYSEYPNFATN